MTVREKDFFLEELKKVPSRKDLKTATREQVLAVAKEINFKAIEEISLRSGGLKLRKKDIPMELLFQANFLFTLSLEFEEELGTTGEWLSLDVWQMKDLETFRMLEKYAMFVKGKRTSPYGVCFFSFDEVVAYAKSKMPYLD